MWTCSLDLDIFFGASKLKSIRAEKEIMIDICVNGTLTFNNRALFDQYLQNIQHPVNIVYYHFFLTIILVNCAELLPARETKYSSFILFKTNKILDVLVRGGGHKRRGHF